MKRNFIITVVMLLVTTIMQAQEIEKPIKKTDPLPPSKFGAISITSNPVGCSIIINGKNEGKSPINLNKTAGTYTIVFDLKGFKSQTKSAKVTSGKTTKIYAELEPVPPTPQDSILLLTDRLISKTPFLPSESLLDDEGKGILAFQKNAIKYALHVKSLYTEIVGATIPSDITDESFAMLAKNNLLKILQSQNLEKSCLNDALKMITVMTQKEGVAKQGFNKEYVIQVMAYQNIIPVPNNNSDLILSLTAESKFREALKVIIDGLLDPQVVARYKAFLNCWNHFYNIADVRLEEIKNSSINE